MVTKQVYNKNYQMITSLYFIRALVEESKVEKGISSASQSSGLYLLDIPKWRQLNRHVPNSSFYLGGGGGGGEGGGVKY